MIWIAGSAVREAPEAVRDWRDARRRATAGLRPLRLQQEGLVCQTLKCNAHLVSLSSPINCKMPCYGFKIISWGIWGIWIQDHLLGIEQL